MKKATIIATVAILATVGLTAQDKDQDKLKLRDGSCLNVSDSNLVTCDRLLLKDGSGSQRNVDKTKGNYGDNDRIRLRDNSCLVEDGIAPQFLNLYKRFKK